MKNSNFINESVFKVNIKYTKLQNETKELFFRCLDEGRDLDYFKAKLEQLWGKVDYSYMEDEIIEYGAIIHEYNVKGKDIIRDIPEGQEGSLFALVPISVILAVDKKFQKTKEREYKNSLNSKAYNIDKEEYLKLKVSRYNDQVVRYELHEYIDGVKTDNIIGYRYVKPSTYNSMIHNTNLTRSGWNTTLNDADSVGVRTFWIPYHSFSCIHCLEHQNRALTKEEVIDLVGFAETAEGDILHPNCKCTLTFYDDRTTMNKPNYSEAELEEQYNIRQKVNSLTLKKEEVATDIRIQKRLGNQDEVDKLNQKRNKINKEIRQLQEALPTSQLKKQVVAINR